MLPSESKTVIGAETDMPVMRWGAIIGGWLVATGFASMLYVAGLAMGFSSFEPSNAEAVAKGIGAGAACWMILTWTVSLLLGGIFASWFDGRSDPTMGTLHGVTVWGLSVTASGLLLAMGLGQALQGGAAAAAGRVPQAQVAQRVAPTNDVPSPDAAAPAATTSPAAQPASRTAGANDPAREEAVKRYTAAAMWVAFLSTLLSLVASGIGGWLGAGHIHRVYHLRRYETRPAAVR